MFAIDSDNNITVTKGDTLVADITILDAQGEEYVAGEGDTLRFGAKRSASGATVLSKIVPLDTKELRLEASETKQLDPGTYYYDIELETESGTVCTIINWRRLEVTEEAV